MSFTLGNIVSTTRLLWRRKGKKNSRRRMITFLLIIAHISISNHKEWSKEFKILGHGLHALQK
jgi:hypothetical protein